jgi:catechol 2,3-dioxygenase-like lactoylglutathione lyase family enzyme
LGWVLVLAITAITQRNLRRSITVCDENTRFATRQLRVDQRLDLLEPTRLTVHVDRTTLVTTSKSGLSPRGIAMIDHVSVPVRDLTVSSAFYHRILTPLGYVRLVERPQTIGFGKAYPELWLNLRDTQSAQALSTGHHLALRARSVAAVDRFHTAALAAGGACDGPPGPRQGAMTGYYGAFIRDPDGNRIEALTFGVDTKP